MKIGIQVPAVGKSSACVGISILLSLNVAPFTAQAGGLWLFEDAGPTVGTASAGRAAVAMDAATARGNAAGMTRLTGEQMVAGAQPIIYTAKFDPDQPGTFGGGDGGDAGAIFPSAALYYVRELAPDWRFGFAVGSALGLGVDYDNDWVGRYYVQESLFTTAGALPSVAYRVTDWLSIGGGVGASYATLDQKAAINNNFTDPGVPDGRLEFDADSWAPFGQVGVLLEPQQGSRFGLNYTSKVEHEFDDSVSIQGLGPNLAAALGPLAGASADLEINLPQQVMLSAYHDVTDQLAIMGNIAWQEWSDFGETNVTITTTAATEVTADRNFDDTWHFALGGMYQVAPDWRLSAGVAYDTSPVNTEDRTPDAPLDRQIRVAGGLQYEFSDKMRFGVAYTYLDGGDADISQSGTLRGDLVGDYERNDIHIIAAHVDWRW
jgi:long-chain fatty acid transport protein